MPSTSQSRPNSARIKASAPPKASRRCNSRPTLCSAGRPSTAATTSSGQLNDHKASIDITKLKPNDLAQYATVCGEALARGHARSGDARIIAGYLGGGKRFSAAILEFATAYAEQTVTDWKELLKQEKPT